eukprot:gene6662-6886_t
MDVGPMPEFTLGSRETEQPRKSPKLKARGHKPINHANHAPPGSGISFAGSFTTSCDVQQPAGTMPAGAFAELDANQQHLFNRPSWRHRQQGSTKQDQQSVRQPQAMHHQKPVAENKDAFVPHAGLPSWAAMLNNLQQQGYASPGAAATAGFARHCEQQQQQQSMDPVHVDPGCVRHPAAAHRQNDGVDAGLAPAEPSGQPQQKEPAAATPVFSFGDLPKAGSSTPVAFAAMSTDTAMPTAAPGAATQYSAMSLDSTPRFVFGGATAGADAGAVHDVCSSAGFLPGQARGIGIGGRRLFETPSSAAGASASASSPLTGTPVFRTEAGARSVTDKVPFPGFGSTGMSPGSPAGFGSPAAFGIAAGPGSPTFTPGVGKLPMQICQKPTGIMHVVTPAEPLLVAVAGGIMLIVVHQAVQPASKANLVAAAAAKQTRGNHPRQPFSQALGHLQQHG